ncbi:SDR family NAD(P)-dependent oxidoreductase [Flavobacterium nitrogenifigens]|uniref:NAD(P)-dependent dehydrogenase, short-chain alcohol dehydrogenase family n=1 Tax=Flavobacterium nitrogenifigens TaxID=1617283 RepID=A0A521AW25_9FLAO|nr:SDR family oxidoreductase [Flavobacterium nitrogenifigens]KAF2329196.1 SDR family oxidoreductase [Flavobacterium nitrogenifigens]SMO39036.1 NAD(P)-dependent dehydrogenase, short-chain alcohol dehydrogenase family [Flavobacterium nitrogenifigens]
MNPFDLLGKKILVTGASSGIGFETCRAIVRQGGTFIAVARRVDFLEKLIEECGNQNSFIAADLSQMDDIKAIVDAIENIDGIVHSAGIVSLAPVKFYSEQLMNEMRSINFDSITYLVNLIFKKKKINKGSSIVLVSSVAGLFGMKGNGIYAATKGALIAISKVWANEFAVSKTRVNCVSPGMVKTEITSKSIENLSLEVIQEDEKKYPLGYGTPEQVADPIVFLLSDASSWITGQNLVLDGGRTSTI